MENELYFDGSCEPINPSGTGRYGYVINKGLETFTGKGNLGRHSWMTNNIAEWTALVKGLEHCVALGIDSLTIYGDSMLVINCASGRWRTKAPHLKQYKIRIEELRKKFMFLRFEWVPREQNYLADELSKQD